MARIYILFFYTFTGDLPAAVPNNYCPGMCKNMYFFIKRKIRIVVILCQYHWQGVGLGRILNILKGTKVGGHIHYLFFVKLCEAIMSCFLIILCTILRQFAVVDSTVNQFWLLYSISLNILTAIRNRFRIPAHHNLEHCVITEWNAWSPYMVSDRHAGIPNLSPKYILPSFPWRMWCYDAINVVF